MMDYFRPKGKIICIGDNLNPELEQEIACIIVELNKPTE
jgi:hypothetical protein